MYKKGREAYFHFISNISACVVFLRRDGKKSAVALDSVLSMKQCLGFQGKKNPLKFN